MLSAVTGLTGFVGGVLSGVLLSGFASFGTASLLGYQWTPYHWLILVSAVLRTQAWRFLRDLKEENAWRTRDVLNWKLWR